MNAASDSDEREIHPLTPEEARLQLATADAFATASAKAARYGALLMAALGILAGTVMFAAWVFALSPLASVIGLTVYVLVPSVLMSWQYRRARAADRGWSLRFGASIGVTTTLFAIGLAWSTTSAPSMAVAVPYSILVALPTLLMAARMARR